MVLKKVATVSELNEQDPKAFDVEGARVLLTKIDSKIYAINAVCSHVGGPLEDGICENGIVTCPWHKSQFDVKTGAVVEGPATVPQATYKVAVDGDDIMVEL